MSNSNYGNFYYQELKVYLEERLDFSFFDKIPSGDGGVVEQSQEFFIFLESNAYDELFLDSNIHTTNLLKTNITDKIIGTAFTIKENIFEEIQKEGQFNFDKNDIINYINFLLVFRDILQASSSMYITDFNKYMYNKEEFSIYFEENLSTLVDEIYENNLTMISPIIIATAIKSFFPYHENSDNVPIISRLVAIFARISKMLPFYKIENNYNMPLALKPYDSIITSLYNNAAFFGLDKNVIKNMQIFSKII